MKDFSKLRQRFWEPINEIPFIIRLLLGVLTVVTVAVFVSKSVEDCLQQLLSEKYDVLKVIGYCVAGVVSIWLAWAANKRANAIDATAREQVNATKNTEEGQRQERLKNAIEHLGHSSDSVRMGGAHELFHLAKDTKKLRQTVLDILCAHIRQMTGKNKYKEKHEEEPSEEIQGLLTLLFREKHEVFKGCSINLQGSYLNGATLSLARLKKANLRQAQLQKADLRYTQLQRARLYKAQLQRANLSKAELQRARLWKAQLQRAILKEAQLQGAVLKEARLQGATLWQARLQGADLSEAQMQGAGLRQARLQSADLRESQLQGANLRYAQLQGANLWEAQLQEADLWEAQLQGVSSQDEYPIGFKNRIRNGINKHSDLKGIIFAGELQLGYLDTLREGLSAEKVQALRENHVGKPASNKLPPNSGAVTAPPSPPYTQEEAEQWIVEYQEAMREVPKKDDG